MIAAAQEGHPGLSVRRLCTLLDANRAWYYAQPCDESAAREEETRLRDAIERVILAFPGTATAASPRPSSATVGPSTTSASCA